MAAVFSCVGIAKKNRDGPEIIETYRECRDTVHEFIAKFKKFSKELLKTTKEPIIVKRLFD